jgi:serine/threonine protein kinase
MKGSYGRFDTLPDGTGVKHQELFGDRERKVETSAMRELLFYRTVRHPNIMRARQSIISNEELHITMRTAQPLTEWICKAGYRKRLRHGHSILRCMARALEFMHGNKILHGDIKPDNFVISGDHVDLIDFGTVQWRHDDRGYSRAITTYWFVAPEDAVHSRYGPAADIWALGLTMLYYWTQIYPLRFASLAEARVWFLLHDSIPIRGMPPRMKRLVARMLDFNSVTRITARAILTELGEDPVVGTIRKLPRDDATFIARLLRSKTASDAVSQGCADAITRSVFSPWCGINIADVACTLGAGRRRVYREMRRLIRNLP